jgi:hypothetical protein
MAVPYLNGVRHLNATSNLNVIIGAMGFSQLNDLVTESYG